MPPLTVLTRMMCVATSGGPNIVVLPTLPATTIFSRTPLSSTGRIILSARQVEEQREETTGCGTRGIYFDDHANGHMIAINRTKKRSGLALQCHRTRLAILCRTSVARRTVLHWTGFDYRGEPNPMEFPATGSQFGILDYCGFPKDEAFYLKSWWTDEPVLHIFPTGI